MAEPSQQKRVIGRHACERCRKAKSRCLTDSLEEYGKCRKCLANNYDCEWKEISKTRVRKRASMRVTDLERQLSSLNAAMDEVRTQTISGTQSRDNQIPETHNVENSTPLRIQETGFIACDAVSSIGDNFPAMPAGSLDPSELPAQTKSEYLEIFVTKMLPQYPVLAVPSQIDIESLQNGKPFTFRAIITTACSILEPKSFRSLHNLNIALLSNAVVVEGRKSMDLLQALLITATWACPPDNLPNLNIYQWSHMACTMALELGLGGRTSLQAQAQNVSEFAADPSEALMERCRTMFGVYLTSSRLAVSFRRQRMLSFSPSTEAMIELFHQHCQSTNDRRLVAWLRSQSIAEDIESMKHNAERRSDPSFMEANSIKSDFAMLQYRLKSWENGVDPLLWIESLRIDFGLCRSKLHELTVYYGEDIHQLDLSALTNRAQRVAPNPQQIVSPRYIRALYSFIEGCQSILDIFLHAGTETLRVLPILTMFRAPFAFKALAMLNKRVRDPNDNISQVIDEDTVAWSNYSDGVREALEIASADKLYAYPSMALQTRETMLKSKRAEHGLTDFQGCLMNYGATGQIASNDRIVDDAGLENPELFNDIYMPF